MNKNSEAYPYLKALLDALLELPILNYVKVPAKFISSLSEQLKDKSEEEIKEIENEIKGISKDELKELIEESSSQNREDIGFIADAIEELPTMFQHINYRFDKVDSNLEKIIDILLQSLNIKPSKIIQYPLQPKHNNITPPEPNFVGRKEMLETITKWYKDPNIRIGALIGWGGVGKSALTRKWYDSLEENKIQPDGIFWWGFYRNAYIDRFLESLLQYLNQGREDITKYNSTWAKVDKIKELINEREYLIILDGFEEMQKSEEYGEEFGCMQHRELTELLRDIAETKGKGLCLITTRYPLIDIKNYENLTYKKVDKEIEHLKLEDARALMAKRGVKSEQEEIDAVIKDFEEHALSLTLLAGYLVKDFKGDIKKAKEIPLCSDEENKDKAYRMLNWYNEQLGNKHRAFMKIFSLFRRSVNEKDFKGVFQAGMETDTNKSLRTMKDFSFKRMVDNLCDRRLISKNQSEEKDGSQYATHPLIKNYFESIFDEEDKKLCHKKIYEYIGTYAPKEANTLEEMQPLFEQVYHGCAAGLYDEVLRNIYWEKINKHEEYFIIHKLGAWETNLSLVRNFFPDSDFSQLPLVNEKSAQSWILGAVGLSLKNTGQLKKVKYILEKHNKLVIGLEDWKNASVGYQNLVDFQFRIGEIKNGFESAKNALEMAEKAYELISNKKIFVQGEITNSLTYIYWSKGYLAYILYLLGKTREAGDKFIEADEVFGNYFRLYGLSGIFYSDYLLSIKNIDEAYKRIKENLIWNQNRYPIDISRCHRSLGAIERIKGNYNESKEHLQEALEIARKVGMPTIEIEALLEWGNLHLDLKEYKESINDAESVLKICEQTGFKFYEPEAEIMLAKVYSANDYEGKDLVEAERYAISAYDKATGMGYRWKEGDAANVLGEIYLANGDKATAKEWLEKALVCRKEILDPNAEETELQLSVIS